MTLAFNWGTLGSLGTNRVRLGRIDGLTLAADRGTVSSCRLVVEDVPGNLVLPGLGPVSVIESAATADPVVWLGYAAERDLARNILDAAITGAAREWDGSLVDMNAAFGFLVARGADAKRPAETVDARIAWCIGEFGASFPDEGHVVSSSLMLSANDYTGMYPSDILNDCGELSGFNYFRYWDQAANHAALAFFPDTYAGFDSTFRLTNVLADVDDSTTFGAVASLNRDPSDRFSGVLVVYNGGQVFVGDRPRIASSRETSFTKDTISSAAHASSFANRFLSEHATDFDEITAIVEVPKEHVNDAMPGQRIAVKFSHLDGYEDWTDIRIAQRSVAQDKETQDRYTITFTLRNPRSTGGSGGGPGGGGGSVGNPGVPPPPPPPYVPPVPEIRDHLWVNVEVAMTANAVGIVKDGQFNVGTVNSFPGTPVVVIDSPYTNTGDFAGDSTAGDGTGLHIHTTGNNMPLEDVSLPLNTMLYVWGRYTSGFGGTAYTDGTSNARFMTVLEGAPPPPSDVTITSTPGPVGTAGDGVPMFLGSFILSTTNADTGPLMGSLVTEYVANDGSGTIGSPTNWPYQPGSLQVFADADTVTIRYIAAGGPATGATNLYTSPNPSGTAVLQTVTEIDPTVGTFSYLPGTGIGGSDLEILDEGISQTATATSIDVVGAAIEATATGDAVTLTVSAELPIEGGQDTIKAHGSMGSTETFDPTDGNVHTGTLNANCTFTLSAPSGSGAATLELYLSQDGTGSRTVTWPGSVVWPGGVTPTLSTAAGSVDRFVLESLDGGTVWYGTQVGSGGSALTIKDEGSALATAATSIDFVGPLVTASGTGAAKTVTVTGALDDLTDVTITSPATADRLRYNGSAWVNSALIWRPLTTYDPTSGLWVPLVDGDGNAIMVEA